jgi:hypothetical protein
MAKRKQRTTHKRKSSGSKAPPKIDNKPLPPDDGGESAPPDPQMVEDKPSHQPTLAEMLANTLPAPDWRR